MASKKNLRDRYIQLVETFITALESGRSGAELENIRNDIRKLSSQLNFSNSVEDIPQEFDYLPVQAERETDPDVNCHLERSKGQ